MSSPLQLSVGRSRPGKRFHGSHHLGQSSRLLRQLMVFCFSDLYSSRQDFLWTILMTISQGDDRYIKTLKLVSIITLMIIENRALWLARSFASSRYNHRAVIITLKASSFQNGSQICWCFGVGNWSIILFSRIIINVIIILKQLVASGDVNISRIVTETKTIVN